MAFRYLFPCHSPYRNLPPIDLMEYELAKDPGFVERTYSGSTPSVLSCNLTLDLTLVLVLVPAPVAINELLKQFMKTYLKSNQAPR